MTAYRELTDLFDFFAKFNIISLSAEAVRLFAGFRKSGIKIGTMDLMIGFNTSPGHPGRPDQSGPLWCQDRVGLLVLDFEVSV